MANVKYSDLLPEVLPNLAADPSDPVTEHAIKRAVIQFCNDSWIWNYLADPMDVNIGEPTYDLEPLPGTDITTVISVAYDTVPMQNKPIDWLNSTIPAWRTTRLTPKYFTQVNTDQIILAPVPESTIPGGLSIILALQPDQRSSGFPKWIYSQYVYSIAQGAIAYLMLMPDKAWSNPQLGVAYMQKFESAIADARGDAAASLGRAPVRSSPFH